MRTTQSISLGSSITLKIQSSRVQQEQSIEHILSPQAVSFSPDSLVTSPPVTSPFITGFPCPFEGFISLAYSKKHEFTLIGEISMCHFDKGLIMKRLLSKIGTGMTSVVIAVDPWKFPRPNSEQQFFWECGLTTWTWTTLGKLPVSQVPEFSWIGVIPGSSGKPRWWNSSPPQQPPNQLCVWIY